MNNKIKEEINNIEIPKTLHKRSKIGILTAKSEMQGNKKRISKMLPYVAMMAIFVILIPLGLSQFNHHLPKDHNKSGKVINNNNVSESEINKTLQTYLKTEFTGPDDAFKNAMKKFNQNGDPSLYIEYIEKKYKPIVTDNVYNEIVNANLSAYYLSLAYTNGYQMKPTNIVIKKAENNGYNCEVEVEYSKNGKTNKATVKVYININQQGKISRIVVDDDGGLLNILR